MAASEREGLRDLILKVLHWLDQLTEKLERLDQDLAGMGAAPGSVGAGSSRRRDRREGRIAFRLSLKYDPGGAAWVTLDDKCLRLPPKLAALLEILAAEGEPSGDPLVGWKNYDSVRRELAERTGQEISIRALHQLVYRLRDELRPVDPGRTLIRRQPGKRALRLALVRSQAAVANAIP